MAEETDIKETTGEATAGQTAEPLLGGAAPGAPEEGSQVAPEQQPVKAEAEAEEPPQTEGAEQAEGAALGAPDASEEAEGARVKSEGAAPGAPGDLPKEEEEPQPLVEEHPVLSESEATISVDYTADAPHEGAAAGAPEETAPQTSILTREPLDHVMVEVQSRQLPLDEDDLAATIAALTIGRASLNRIEAIYEQVGVVLKCDASQAMRLVDTRSKDIDALRSRTYRGSDGQIIDPVDYLWPGAQEHIPEFAAIVEIIGNATENIPGSRRARTFQFHPRTLSGASPLNRRWTTKEPSSGLLQRPRRVPGTKPQGVPEPGVNGSSAGTLAGGGPHARQFRTSCAPTSARCT